MRSLIVVLFLLVLPAYLFAQIDQTAVDRQVNYLNSQIKYFWDQQIFNPQITPISASQYESQKPADALSFDCGYLDDDGKVFVSDPVTDAQKKIFRNITDAALYYASQSFLRFYFRVKTMPVWFIAGFAAFEADLKIDDNMIKEAINNYGGSIPSFTRMNDRAEFDSKNCIAIAYLWGELMNVTYGWWRYFDVKSITADEVVMNSADKSMSYLFGVFRRYTNMRILETIERFRLKFQGESDHFKYYYRDNENYCMPYMQNELEAAYTQYSTELAVQSSKKATYSFQPECEGAKLDSAECIHRYTGGTAWVSGVVTSCAEKAEDLPMFGSLVRHELAHLFQFLIKPNFMPAWLSEGFASFMPDGIMNEQVIRNETGFAVYKFEYAKSKIGHYPTIAEMEDYDFNSRNGLDYYLFGLLMNDFVVRKGGYIPLKSIIQSNGQDFSSLGYSTKQQFEDGFYDYYNTYWAPKPKTLSIKKTMGKPVIDGIISEPVWDKSIVLNRKFFQEGSINNVPSIDNSVTASMVWDEDNLYIAIEVADASLSCLSYVDFLNDGIEVDIDPDLSRGVDFKDNDMAFIWNVVNSALSYRTGMTGANFSFVKNGNGYTAEFAIPWNVLGVIPSAGKKFGLELINYDQDNGVYKGTYVFSGHTWQGGVALNGLAEVTLSSELAAKGLQLVSPAGGEAFIEGDKEVIQFNGFNVANVNIEFSQDGGASWNSIASNVPALSGIYNWNVPVLMTDRGLIRITDSADPSLYRVSQAAFKIVRSNSKFGPYINDTNTKLLLHLNNNFHNYALTGDGNGGGAVFYPSAKSNLGNSASFSSPLSLPNSQAFNLTADFTIEMWVKINSFNPNGTTLISKPGDNDSYWANFTLEINPWWGNVFHGFYFDQSGSRVAVSGFTPQLNKWYHVAYTRKSSSKEIKIEIFDENDAQIAVIKRNYTETSPLLINTQDLVIGRDLDGYIDEVRISNICRDFTVSVDNKNISGAVPTDFCLKQNYPNPFNPATTIAYSLPVSEEKVTLKIYDSIGREVAVLVDGFKTAGNHSVSFNASHLPSGVYMYRLNAGAKTESRKMILMK